MSKVSLNFICRNFRRRDARHNEQPLVLGEASLYYLDYVSKNEQYLVGHPSYSCREHDLHFDGEQVEEKPSDEQIAENTNFSYLLLRGAGSTRLKRVLFLLHGLNERSFSKYLIWAYEVWQRTGVLVVLFPLTLSINRVLPQWASQIQESYERRRQIPGNINAHPFNATISERLDQHPERFFWGGLESYHDLVDLVRQIRDGQHEHIAPDAQIDFLGYSSGGYLALTLLLTDPEGMLSDSRAVLFASCVMIRELSPSSPYILDHAAENALRKLLVDRFESHIYERMSHWFAEHPEGIWLRSFCGRLPDRARVEERLREIAPRLLGIANISDQVMPYGAMLNSLQGIRRDTGVRVEAFKVGIHENPFGCPDYNQRDRRFLTVCLDEELYAREFKQFIEWIVEHLKQ